MSYIFYSPISKPILKTEEMLKFAKANCPSYITNDLEVRGQNNWYYRFYFGDEKDYMLFVLRWS
jgi:hypothetical protein